MKAQADAGVEGETETEESFKGSFCAGVVWHSEEEKLQVKRQKCQRPKVKERTDRQTDRQTEADGDCQSAGEEREEGKKRCRFGKKTKRRSGQVFSGGQGGGRVSRTFGEKRQKPIIYLFLLRPPSTHPTLTLSPNSLFFAKASSRNYRSRGRSWGRSGKRRSS